MGAPGALGTLASPLFGIEQGLYRVSVGAEPRAVLWHDEAGGVAWLCAGLSFPEGDPQDRALYAEVERLHSNDRLLPTPDERLLARAESFWLSIVARVGFAMRQARQLPFEWFDADVVTADGATLRYARVMVEQARESDGVLRDHYLVVLRQPPEDLPHPGDWQSLLFAELTPDGGTVLPVYVGAVPKGANVGAGDVVFVISEEVLDEEDAEGDNSDGADADVD